MGHSEKKISLQDTHILSVTCVRKRCNDVNISDASNQYLNLNCEEREKVNAQRKMRYQYSCTPVFWNSI